jgi:hypothetical protein
MAQGIFEWLEQKRPPETFMGPGYPEAGDLPSFDPSMAEQPYAPPPQNASPEYHPNPAGGMDNEGIQSLPETGDGVYLEDAPDPRVTGSEGDVDNWDYSYETIPVYAVPREMGGGEYVGLLEWAPSLPQDLKPIRYVKVPRSNKMS